MNYAIIQTLMPLEMANPHQPKQISEALGVVAKSCAKLKASEVTQSSIQCSIDTGEGTLKAIAIACGNLLQCEVDTDGNGNWTFTGPYVNPVIAGEMMTCLQNYLTMVKGEEQAWLVSVFEDLKTTPVPQHIQELIGEYSEYDNHFVSRTQPLVQTHRLM